MHADSMMVDKLPAFPAGIEEQQNDHERQRKTPRPDCLFATCLVAQPKVISASSTATMFPIMCFQALLIARMRAFPRKSVRPATAAAAAIGLLRRVTRRKRLPRTDCRLPDTPGHTGRLRPTGRSEMEPAWDGLGGHPLWQWPANPNSSRSAICVPPFPESHTCEPRSRRNVPWHCGRVAPLGTHSWFVRSGIGAFSGSVRRSKHDLGDVSTMLWQRPSE